MFFRNKSKVTVDTGIIVAALIYKSSTLRNVLETVKEKDEMMLSNIILFQCKRQSKKRNCPYTSEEIEKMIRDIFPDVVRVDLVPLEVMKALYRIRDDDDLEILYSADMTDSEIILSSDRDFFDKSKPILGINAKIMNVNDYMRSRGKLK